LPNIDRFSKKKFSPAHTSDAASNHSYTALPLDRIVDFVVSWIETRTIRRPHIWKFL